MTGQYNHRASFFHKTWKAVTLLVFILCCFSFQSFGQNAKGDKPVSNKGKVREARFKSRSKQGDRARTKDVSGRRIRTKNKSSAHRAAAFYKQPKTARTKARGADRAGKPVSTISRSKPRDTQSAAKSRRVQVRSATSKSRNIYPQFGKYTHNTARKPPKRVHRSVSNRPQLARLKKMQSNPPSSGRGKRKVVPRSASRSFTARKSINPIARFKRKEQKGERPVTRDLAGRRLRTKNFETKRPPVAVPSTSPYYGRKKKVGDKPYRGPGAGVQLSPSKPTQRAWRGDPSGRRIRGKNYSSKPGDRGGAAYALYPSPKPRYGDKIRHGKKKGVGFKSASGKRKGRGSLPVRAPGIGADGLGEYSGNIKARRRPKGGGSVSGKLWNNKQTPVTAQGPSDGTQRAGRFQGNIKAKRRLKGGGSVSGKLWNNKQTPVTVQGPSDGTQRAGRFQGNIKAKRPLKGGGSVSGKLWNNKQTPVTVRGPSEGTQRAGRFQGNIKARRPEKGGGSVSGKLWNNKQTPVAVRPPSSGTQRAGAFQGNIKTRRPEKGGGSVSGKLWNNKERPLSVQPPSSNVQRAGRFQGDIKAKRPEKGGGSISGKLWNNKETPIPVKSPTSATESASRHRGNEQFKPRMRDQGEEFTGVIKLNRSKGKYGKNPGIIKESVSVKTPTSETERASRYRGSEEFKPRMRDQGEEFTGYIKLNRFKRNYVKNPNSADEALKKARPDKSTFKVDDMQVKLKQPQYARNPSSAGGALKVREPGKAFGREADYQGNIKMKKFDVFAKNKKKGLHPDSQFVKINKNNVKRERDLITNIKLWWAKKFKKNETQPNNVREKDKEHRPRYDKGEEGLWYD